MDIVVGYKKYFVGLGLLYLTCLTQEAHQGHAVFSKTEEGLKSF